MNRVERHHMLMARARHMRANPTDAEQALWRLLRCRRFDGYKWKRQEIVDDLYIVDFVCYAERLIVEADGSQHADSQNDTRRDAYLKAQGFTVLRFWNNELLANLEGAALAILSAIESSGTTDVAPPPSLPPLCGSLPLPQGERVLHR